MKETDKRKVANKTVKLKIARALTRLMDEKPFSDISVSEIVETAGVARASYYRNFSSKESILTSVTDDIMSEYHTKMSEQNIKAFSYDNILLIFRYFKTYKKFILSVYRAGLASLYLDMFDRDYEEMIGDMPYNDINRYKIYVYSGAMYNVFIKWLEDDMREDPEDMARLLYDTMFSKI